jgi:hypothetical protein
VAAIIIVLSLGIPYWYYRFYRYQNPHGVKRSTDNGADSGDLEQHADQWMTSMTRLKSQWKAFTTISAGALPCGLSQLVIHAETNPFLRVVFPMLAIYTDSRCSWASFLAAIGLLSGVASMVLSSLFQHFSEVFHEEATMKAWHKVL